MSISVTCAACAASFKVKDEFAGRRGKCPSCGATVQVPGAAGPSVAGPPKTTAAANPPPAKRKTVELDPTVAAPRPQSSSRPKLTATPQNPAVQKPAAAPKPAQPTRPVTPRPAPVAASISPLDIGEDFDEPLRAGPALQRPSLGPLGRRNAGQNGGSPKIKVPIWAWGVGATAAVLFVVGLTVVATMAMQKGASSKPVAVAVNRPVSPPRAPVVQSNPAPFNPEIGKQAALKSEKPQAGAPLEDIVEYVKHSIVKVEISDAFNHRQGLGSGFLIDAKGLVATNYHVVSDAVKAEVVFNDGTRYGVEGYVALNPQTDLCVLKLNGVPPQAKALSLVTADGPRDASKVYAIGHPYDHEFTTTDGIVGRVVHTSQFPDDIKAFLRDSLQGEPDNVWIQHNAKINPGNSGGPLINSAGDVLGVNSWISEKLGFGYAIHSKHLQNLINTVSATVTPLKDRRRKMQSQQGQLAQSPIASARLQKLAADLSAKRWSPKGAEDFASLDSLAFGMTVVRFIQAGADVQVPMPAEEQLALVQVVDQIVDTLRKMNWQDNEQILPINTHASKSRRRSEGAFLFGVIKQRAVVDGERGWLMELKGTNRLFFMPTDTGDAEFKGGDCVLVLGITAAGDVRFGENRLKPITAGVVVSKVMIKVADGAPGASGMSGQLTPEAGPVNNPRPNMGSPSPRPGSRTRPGSRRPGSSPRGTN